MCCLICMAVSILSHPPDQMRVFRPEFHTAALGRDFLDPEVGCSGSAGNSFTQLYNLDAVAYESVLVGLFSIFTGKECGKMCNVTGQHTVCYLNSRHR